MTTTFENILENAMQAPHNQDIWADLFLKGFQPPHHPLLPTLLDQREKLFGDTTALLFKALWRDNIYEDESFHKALIEFTTSTKETSIPLTACRFFSAAMLIKAGNLEKAIQELQFAEVGLMNDVEKFKEIPHYLLIPGMLKMLSSEAEILEAEEKFETPLQSAAYQTNWSKAPDSKGSSFIIFTSCDGKYWEKFGPDFMKAVKDKAPIHLHLVNPLPDQEEKLATLDLSYSIEHQTERASSPYYACGRFLLLPQLLEQSKTDIVMLDIDLLRLHDFDSIIEKAQGADISYFAMRTLVPWLRHHAALIYWKNNADVLRYANILQKLLWDKLKGTNWYVDQLAMLSLYDFFQKHDGPAIQLLEPEDGFAFAKYVTPAGEDQEKWEMRKEAGL